MMAEFIGLVGLGVTLIFTQYVTAKSTQKIVTKMDRNTQCTLQKILKLQEDTHRILVATHELQKSTHELQKAMITCLRKIDLGMRANAKMHGWVRLDNISPEEAAKLPEPKEYDPELRVCYYKLLS
jgi:hypothetical protein